MAECISCGGFVTDDYARVFGNNNNRVESCRGCRADRDTDEAETESEQPVLLRDIRGTDADQVGRRAGVAGEPETESTGETAAATAAEGPAEPPESKPKPNDGFGLGAIRSTIRSIAR